MANNSRENYIRIIKNLKVNFKVRDFNVSLPIDFYVMTTKGDGYPLILGLFLVDYCYQGNSKVE